jgi:predicted dehydrogenase
MSLRVGIVGAGVISQTLHLPVLTALPEARVAWVADAAPARAAAVGHAFGVASVPVADVLDGRAAADAVLLAIPIGVRRPYLEALARAGAGVLVEKPFARSRAEHAALSALFAPNRLACGFMRRTYASTMLARRILESGMLGEPRGLRVTEGGRSTKTGADRSYFDDPAAGGGGILLELGCHALDLVANLFDATGHRVLRQAMVRDGHVDRRAEGELLLERTGAGPLPLEYVFSWLDPQDNCVEIQFESATLKLSVRPEGVVTLQPRRRGPPLVLQAETGGAVTSNQAFALEWRWFLDGLVTGEPSAMAAQGCQVVTALVEDLYAAAGGLAS